MRATWSKPEVKSLVNLYRKGLTPGEIGSALERTTKSVESMIWRLQQGPVEGVMLLPWWHYETVKIGHLDIETSNLEGNAGFMLSWAIKVTGEDKPRGDCIKGSEIRDAKSFDKRICTSLVENLRELDVITTYWGTGFDVPFMRTRCMGWDLPFPGYGTLVHWDLFYKVRSKLKLHRNSLASACAFFGIQGKTNLDMEIWFKARVGHDKSLGYVYEHNLGDVEILEKLWAKLEPHSKWTRSPI